MLGILPSKDDYIELQNEYKFKSDQTNYSETTLAMLKQDFKKRQADFEKLEVAEVRMNEEIKTLNEKIIKMNGDIDNKFNNVESYQL